MSRSITATYVEVWKFKETGLVALCKEVTEFVAEGGCARYNLDYDSAYFDDRGDLLVVVFDRLPQNEVDDE